MNNLFDAHKNLIENRLSELLHINSVEPAITEAMSYSVNAGGKRLRPILNLLANSLLDGDINETLDIACAIEMIHTYSLIHDDLPAMDNDTLRRGKPTNHIIYGEAIAILSGDGLLNYAFEIMLNNAMKYHKNALSHLKSMCEIAESAGIKGMISGQCLDVLNEGQILNEFELESTHNKKTGALIVASLLSGLFLCNPSEAQINAVKSYGENVGLAFQITDDILDVTGDKEILGKTTGKDKNSKKFTFPTLFGIEGSIRRAEEKINRAKSAIYIFGDKAQPLEALAENILKRKK